MRTRTAGTSVAIATALAGALTAALAGMAGPAGAATKSHVAMARADWKAGAQVAAAQENTEWIAARDQLAAYGGRYVHEQADLDALISIPLTDTTAAQRATAARVTRELNGFFRTPGLYAVAPGNAKAIARADWIKSAQVSAAEENDWFGAAIDELDSYGKRFATQRAELASLEAIPLTDTTAKQRATARRDVRALNAFFHTPGLFG
jgi:hypothetical protein